MKLIGEKSLSTVLYKLLFVGTLCQLLYLGYLILGFGISYINQSTGTHYLEKVFMIGNFEGEIKKADPEVLSFRFKMPFSDAVTTGDYTLYTLMSIVFFLGFYSLFTFYLFRIFKGMSSAIIFNKDVIIHLKHFAVLNILFIPLYSVVLFFINQSFYTIDPLFILLHFSTGVIILFIMEFFKKGYELQTQSDLTI